MLISIITPTFNSELYLSGCLESVRNQSYKNIEHILIDCASEDDTIKIAKGYPHISKMISEPDHGIYDAMNKGIKWATGDIIGILNSDDAYASNEVIQAVAHKFRDKNIMAVYGDLNYINTNNKIIRKWRSGEYREDLFPKGWMPPHPTFFIRKACYDQYGLYNTGLTISADYELMLRMLYKYKVPCAYLPEVLVSMRTGGKSNHSFKARWLANRQDREAWKLNGLKPEWLTLWKKPLSKLKQYLPVRR